MRLAFLTLLLCFATVGFSQRQYFVFVESENRQPIFVRIGETTYNSSAIGHIIIPALHDSVYTLEIGLAADQAPSNQFVIRINKKDHGYQLKKLNDKGWVLFNFQTMELVYPLKKDGLGQSGYSLVKRDDSFARLLSQVVNDTTVLYSIVEKPAEPVVKTAAKVKVDSPTVKKEDISVVQKQESQTEPTTTIKEEPVKTTAAESNSTSKLPLVTVTKVRETESDSGKHLVYLDQEDSVKIFISAEVSSEKSGSEDVVKEPAKPANTDASSTNAEKLGAGAVSTDSAQKPELAKKPDAEALSQSNQKQDVKDTVTQQKKLVLLNSDCKALAWDHDVDKVRLKMLNEKDVDSKINIARKVFKTKCFSAAQIKGLTELFLTDQDKYKFLDAAYPFVFDTENFKQLSYLLTDEYYVKRFRTMVRLD